MQKEQLQKGLYLCSATAFWSFLVRMSGGEFELFTELMINTYSSACHIAHFTIN